MLWPTYAYSPGADHRFNIGYLDGFSLCDTTGHMDHLRSWIDLAYVLERRNLLLISEGQCASELWCYADIPSTYLQGEDPSHLVVRHRGKRGRVHWIMPELAWNTSRLEFPLFLQALQQVYRALDVGHEHSPAALGKRSMLRELAGNRYALPNGPASHDLKRPATGKRQYETVPFDGERFEGPDLEFAYVNAARVVPAGTAVLLAPGYDSECVTWFRHCIVTINRELRLGPFPVRDGAAVQWPTAPGQYDTWLWREQAHDSLASGCVVSQLEGWGWPSWTRDLEPWCDRMCEIRAELGWSSPAGTLLKVCALAAIGALGIGSERRSVVGGGDRPGDLILPGREVNVRQSAGHPTMIHWQRYIEMTVGRRMYHLALAELARGRRVVAFETDKLILAA